MENLICNQPRKLVLYSDVDGTLIGKSGELCSTTIQEIERFVAAGHGFTLATGRSFRGVKRLLNQIPINTPLVLCNGAYVYDPVTGHSLWSSLSHSIVNEVLPLLESIPGVRIYMERSDSTLWIKDSTILLEPYILKEDLQPRIFHNVEEVFAGGEVLKMGAKFTDSTVFMVNQIQEIISYLSFDLDSEVSWCFSSTDYLEIMLARTSKWSGILGSQALRGCRDKTIVTVGDHHNDVEMILNADIGIAMGNAVAAVKEVAVNCIGDVENEAMVTLLAEIRIQEESKDLRDLKLQKKVLPTTVG